MTTQAAVQDPIKFLELYRKIEKMNPLAYERFCGIVDGVNLAYELAAEKSTNSAENGDDA